MDKERLKDFGNLMLRKFKLLAKALVIGYRKLASNLAAYAARQSPEKLLALLLTALITVFVIGHLNGLRTSSQSSVSPANEQNESPVKVGCHQESWSKAGVRCKGDEVCQQKIYNQINPPGTGSSYSCMMERPRGFM